jgi:predicted aminopeptidase
MQARYSERRPRRNPTDGSGRATLKLVRSPLRPALVLLVFLAALPASGCWTASYLAQQGVGQLRLLRARQRISDVLADPRVAAETKRRLRLAVAARDFGVRHLGLRGDGNYTRYLDTHGAPVAWMVSAAPPDRLVPHRFRFPLVGALPYVGFFRESAARAEAARLARLGLDTYVRPVAGYSTIGITSDPVYSSMLEGSDARIVEVTLHEMAHGTVFVPGQAEWNESFATLVGLEGAARFFAQADQTATARQVFAAARRRERAQARFAAFLAPVTAALRALYAAPISRAEKLRRREAIFAQARVDFARRFPLPPGAVPHPFLREPLNNAVIVAYSVYHRDTPVHRRMLRRLGGDLRALVRLYRHAVELHRDPLRYLARL